MRYLDGVEGVTTTAVIGQEAIIMFVVGPWCFGGLAGLNEQPPTLLVARAVLGGVKAEGTENPLQNGPAEGEEGLLPLGSFSPRCVPAQFGSSKL